MSMRFTAPVWAIALFACGAGADYGADYFGDAGNNPVSDGGTIGCLSSSECPTGFICNEFGRCEQPPPPPGDGPPQPPPETESKIGVPVSSQRFVYVAMTAQDELARIDGSTLAVRATPVGESPKVVTAIPHGDGAVVLDSSNGTATVVRPAGDADTIRVLPTLVNLNRLDVDPSGRFAVVWFDLTKAIADGGGIGGIGSFQDVTVISLAQGTEQVVNLTVGFRPREVQFDAAGNRAYVITQDGVSVINLGTAIFAGPSIVPPIAVADPSVAPEDLEVNVVAGGDFCVVRQTNSPRIRVVGLAGLQIGFVREIQLTSPATDIDLAPDGARAYVVQRAAKKLSIVDVPADAIDPNGVVTLDLTDGTVGSFVLSSDGKRALLFTNATLDERITMVKLDQPGTPHVTFPLKKAVRAVGIAPDGKSAIVLHAKAFGDPNEAGSVDEFIDKSFGYSVLDLATGFAKLQVTPVDPGPFAFSPDGAKAYVALDGGDADLAKRAVQIINTQTGVVIEKQLGSPPSAVGFLPSVNAAFTAQRHPLGRVSFIDLTSDQVRTVTGFDLNGHVVN